MLMEITNIEKQIIAWNSSSIFANVSYQHKQHIQQKL
jgi:hypothetical protein